MNIIQVTICLMFSLTLLTQNFYSTTAQDTHHQKSANTRSELLNEQNRYKHVLYTLLSQNYIDADGHKDIEDNFDKAIENDKGFKKMEHCNFFVDYLKLTTKEINNKILNLDEDQWNTKYDNIMNIYKKQKKLREMKLAENTNFIENLKKLTDTKSENNNHVYAQVKHCESAKSKHGPLRFKRSPLERRPISFFNKIFNFDRNMSIELKDNERMFATVFLKGRKPEKEKGRY